MRMQRFFTMTAGFIALVGSACGTPVGPASAGALTVSFFAPPQTMAAGAQLEAAFDDGSGQRTLHSRDFAGTGSTRMSEPSVTDNDGTLNVDLAIVAGDTVGVASTSRELRPYWNWTLHVNVGFRAPRCIGCSMPVGYPLARHLEGAFVDSFYVSWSGGDRRESGGVR